MFDHSSQSFYRLFKNPGLGVDNLNEFGAISKMMGYVLRTYPSRGWSDTVVNPALSKSLIDWRGQKWQLERVALTKFINEANEKLDDYCIEPRSVMSGH